MKGNVFQSSNKKNLRKMLKSELLQWCFNRTPIWNIPKRNFLLKKLLGSIDGNPYLIQNPIHISYGNNIHIGKNFMANYNCTMMDYAQITIGDNVWLGPNVSLLTVNHPIEIEKRRIFYSTESFHPERKSNWEIVAPIIIGDDVWIGAGVMVLAGVNIGNGTIIGAGSVVTHDIPENVVACGNPCKVMRELS